MELKDIIEKLNEHERNDDSRFSDLRDSVKDIQRFTNRLEPLLFPEEGSGQTPPLDLIRSHEKLKQNMRGVFWIMGIFFTLCVAYATIYHK